MTAVVHRPPVPVIAASAIIAVRTVIGCYGLVYFGIFVGPDVNPAAGSPSSVAFAAVGLVYAITALASLPGFLRGRRTAWHLLTCVIAAQILFAGYKIFVAGEDAVGVVFGVVDLLVAALLVLPATRRHVSA